MATKTMEPLAGDYLYDVLREATELAAKGDRVEFEFNGVTHDVEPGETFLSAKKRVEKRTGFKLLSREQASAKAASDLALGAVKSAEAIAKAEVPTEAQLRDSEAPWPKTLDELSAYIKTLTDRPHDYGTCVYAMSLAATAAFNYVAHELGTTGFQASCADLDILRRTRDLKHGFKLIDYQNLLYPQYWDAERAPIWRSILAEEKTRAQIAKAAQGLLDKQEDAESLAPRVKAHWETLAAGKLPAY